MKRRLYTALVVLVALLSSLVLVLPGALKDNNVAQIDGVQHLTAFEGVGRGRLLFFDDFSNATNWKVSSGSVETSLVVQGTLNFSVVFDASSIPQAASISRSLNVSLTMDQLPICKSHSLTGLLTESDCLEFYRTGLPFRPGGKA